MFAQPLTILHQEGREAGSSPYHHAEAQGPTTPPAVHGRPQEQVCRQFNGSSQKEVQELVTTQHWRVVGQSHVNTCVGKPGTCKGRAI
jgi:hypothetical protein